MPFQVISPMLMNVDGSDFNEAVKNFVKLNRHLNINELILTDQINNMRANIRYYNKGGRNKAGIRLEPTTSRIISTIPGTNIGIVTPATIGPNLSDPSMPFTLSPSFGTAKAIIGPNGEIHNINPVVPVTTDGKPIRPMVGISPNNILGIGASGPIITGTPIMPLIPPTPVTFRDASTISSGIEWVDDKDTKYNHSDIIEKAYQTLPTNKIGNVRVTIPSGADSRDEIVGTAQFINDKTCIVKYTSTSGSEITTILTRKGSKPRLMVGVNPRIVGVMPRW